MVTRRDNEDADEWRSYATGRFQVRPLPADHYELMEAPHTGAIARLVKTTLTRPRMAADGAPFPP
jgi:hypothetical protein